MKANKMIIGLACLLACTVFALALDENTEVSGIQGTYTTLDGSPLGSVRVILYDSRMVKELGMLTGDDGSFKFSGLRPGVYYLEFVLPEGPSVWYGGASCEPIVVGTALVTVEIVAPR